MVHFACGDAMSAKRLETFDVVADVASARARRFRGGFRGARTPLQVCKSRFGGYAWAGARQGAFAHDFATSTASSSAFDALNTFGAIPRGARRAMDSVGGGRREATPKTARERPQSPRRRARDGDARAERLRRFNSPSTSCLTKLLGRGSVNSRPTCVSRTSTPPTTLLLTHRSSEVPVPLEASTQRRRVRKY